MINMLIDELPTEVEGLEINSDFRTSILFELLMQDNQFNNEEKIVQAIELYYPKPDKILDFEKAIDNILWFYRCGENLEERKKYKKKEKQIYNYEFDDKYIFSAFMEQYNINLNKIKYLHWWEFKALFNSLNEEVLFSKIMSYRAMDLSKIKDQKIKKRYKKLQELYALPDMRTEEEKENDFANEFL